LDAVVMLKLENKTDRLRCGFSKDNINPKQWETWNDLNKDGLFQPWLGEHFDDLDKDGKFDGIFLTSPKKGKCLKEFSDNYNLICAVIEYPEGLLCIVNYDGAPIAYKLVEKIKRKLKNLFKIKYILFIPNMDKPYPDLIGDYGFYHFSGLNLGYYHVFESACINAVDKAILDMDQYSVLYSDEADNDGYLIKNSQGKKALILFTDYPKVNGYHAVPLSKIREQAEENKIHYVFTMNNSNSKSLGVIKKENALIPRLESFQPIKKKDDLYFKSISHSIQVPLFDLFFDVFCNKKYHQAVGIRSYVVDISVLSFYDYFIFSSGLTEQKILPDIVEKSLSNDKEIIIIEGVNERIVSNKKIENILFHELVEIKENLELNEIMEEIEKEEKNELN